MDLRLSSELSDEIREKAKNIKLIALDLDGTTLTREGLSRRTKETLEEAIRRGIEVVIATGRAYTSLPESIHKIEGLKRIITSNGAHITDCKTGEFFYSNYLNPESVRLVHGILSERPEFPMEVFTKGVAYIDSSIYEDLEKNGSTFMSTKYILRTRRPVEKIYDFLLAHEDSIENLNIHFEFPQDRLDMLEVLRSLPAVTITSSEKNNLEVGGETTSKANALIELCKELDIGMEHVMAFGDSPNDIHMITEAGIGVAMGNGEDCVKEAADLITLGNNDEGVAYAIRTILFGQEGGVPEAKHFLKS
jgi:Cof subfamily protein (haloacid dehalogenase superfamily)